MTTFLEKIDQAQSLLERSGRVSLRALRRELSLDDEELDDLVEELVVVRGVSERNGNVLQWASPTGTTETGERRQLTVMFCDLVGSTALSERLDPEELREVLVEYRKVCDEAIEGVQGHVAQYLGDGVMVYFGYPLAQEDAADRAIRAGLEIQSLLKARHDGRINARIGIHTGTVVLDRAATGDKALALGSTTNVASRIEGQAKPGTVLVSSVTLANCRGEYSTQSLGKIELKGVGHAIELLEVQGATKLRKLPRLTSSNPLFGRDAELVQILQRWEQTAAGIGQTLVLVGEAGIGKSRLVQAAHEQLRASRHLWLEMECSPFTSGSAFQPLIDLQRSLFELSASDSREHSRDKLIAWVEAQEELTHSDVIPYLIALLQLPSSDRYPLPQTSTGEQRERTLKAMLALFVAMTMDSPVVLVLEDLHWTDPSTLEFLGRLIEGSQDKRLMLIVTSRPTAERLREQERVTVLELSRLGREATREMILRTAGGRLPERVLSELEARSDGVPLFISELTAGVVTSGGMVEHDGDFKLHAGAAELAIPMTLQDSLMARLDRLNASKTVAQQAATLGREVPFQLLATIAELDEDCLIAALGDLVAGGILFKRGKPPDAVYTFKHALIRDAAYGSQLISARRVLHAKVVKSLQKNFPLRVQAEPELIARHCAAADLHAEAVDYYHRAAELAEKRLSNREAVDHYVLALNALQSMPEDERRIQREVALRLAQTKALTALRGYDDPGVRSNISRIEELCAALPEGPTQLPALLALVQLDLMKGANVECRQRGIAILEIAESLGIPYIIGIANFVLGGTDLLLGSPVSARERLARVVSIHELEHSPPPATSNDPELLSTAYLTYASVLATAAEFDDCKAACQAGVIRAKEHGNDVSVVQSFALAALSAYLMDDTAFARTSAESALELAKGRGFHTPELMAIFPLGWAYACEGQLPAALAAIERGREIARTTGSVSGIELLCLMSADVYRMAEDRQAALAMLEQAEQLTQNRTVGYTGQIALVRARIEIALGSASRQDIEAILLKGYKFAEEAGYTLDRLLLATELGRLAETPSEAASAHARLLPIYEAIRPGQHSPLIKAKTMLDRLTHIAAR